MHIPSHAPSLPSITVYQSFGSLFPSLHSWVVLNALHPALPHTAPPIHLHASTSSSVNITMHFPTSASAPAAACLSVAFLPCVSAFHPLHLPSENIRGQQPMHAPVLPVTNGSLTLPLRRTPIRRENKWQIDRSKDPKQANSFPVDQQGHDRSYMVTVTIGSSQEEYNLLIDTGAYSTWVMAGTCELEQCLNHNTFGGEDSPSVKVSPLPMPDYKLHVQN